MGVDRLCALHHEGLRNVTLGDKVLGMGVLLECWSLEATGREDELHQGSIHILNGS